jgi:hypothetical protein
MITDLPQSHPWLYNQFANNGHHTVRRSDRFWAGISTDLAIEQILMRSLKCRGGLTRGRGMTETVRLTWVQTMHHCAAIHRAMTELTGMYRVTSDQHAEVGKSRTYRDVCDQQKLFTWLESHDPFRGYVTGLVCLSSGLTAVDSDGINCDQAEDVGAAIQMQMDGLPFSDVSLKKSSTVKNLLQLQDSISVNKKALHIDSANLFQKLIVLISSLRCENVAPYFDYELAPKPASFFKDGLMRKPDRATLGRLLSKNVAACEVFDQANMQYVLDGGSLMHRVRRLKTGTYVDAVECYIKHMRRIYKNTTAVVFDGYDNGPSTKDHEHRRRSCKSCASVTLTDSAAVFLSQERNTMPCRMQWLSWSWLQQQ